MRKAAYTTQAGRITITAHSTNQIVRTGDIDVVEFDNMISAADFNALLKANKNFDFLLYPGEDHNAGRGGRMSPARHPHCTRTMFSKPPEPPPVSTAVWINPPKPATAVGATSDQCRPRTPQLDFARLRGVAERVGHTNGEIARKFLLVRAMI